LEQGREIFPAMDDHIDCHIENVAQLGKTLPGMLGPTGHAVDCIRQRVRTTTTTSLQLDP
jgi:hypothetical protein